MRGPHRTTERAPAAARAVGAVVAVAAIGAPVAWASSAVVAAAEPVEIVASSAGATSTELTVVVPRTLRARTVPPEAFVARTASGTVPVRAARLDPSAIDIVVVVSSAGSPSLDAGVRAAVVELGASLPTGARVAMVTGEPPEVRAPLRAGIDGARAAGDALTSDVLGEATAAAVVVAAELRDPARELVIVAIGRDGTAAVAESAGVRDVPVHTLEVGSSSTPSTARNAGGGLRFVRGAAPPIDALDAVLDDMSGRYRVSIDASADVAPLTLALRFAGVEGEATVRPGTAPTASVGTLAVDGKRPAASEATATDRGTTTPWRPVGVAIALLVALGGTAAWALRRRTTHGPASAGSPDGSAGARRDAEPVAEAPTQAPVATAGPLPMVVVLADPGDAVAPPARPAGPCTIVHDADDALRALVRLRAETLVVAARGADVSRLAAAVARHDGASDRSTVVLRLDDDGTLVDLREGAPAPSAWSQTT